MLLVSCCPGLLLFLTALYGIQACDLFPTPPLGLLEGERQLGSCEHEAQLSARLDLLLTRQADAFAFFQAEEAGDRQRGVGETREQLLKGLTKLSSAQSLRSKVQWCYSPIKVHKFGISCR